MSGREVKKDGVRILVPGDLESPRSDLGRNSQSHQIIVRGRLINVFTIRGGDALFVPGGYVVVRTGVDRILKEAFGPEDVLEIRDLSYNLLSY